MPNAPSQHDLNAAARDRLRRRAPVLHRRTVNLVLVLLAPLSWTLAGVLSVRPPGAPAGPGWVGSGVLLVAYAGSALVTKWAFAQRQTRWQLAAFWIGSAGLELARAARGDASFHVASWVFCALGSALGIALGRMSSKRWLAASLR